MTTRLHELSAELRAEWDRVVRLRHAADEAAHAFEALVSRRSGEICVPPGWAIDYLGGGMVRPLKECAPVPAEFLPQAKNTGE